MSRRTVKSEWGLRCPHCGEDSQIDIVALISVRLTPDGTDADISRNGDHEWDDKSNASCVNCDFNGTVADFRIGSISYKMARRAQRARKEVGKGDGNGTN